MSAEITLLYDGECPLCVREASMLRRMDNGRGRLGLVDIAAPGFEAERYGLTFEGVMGAIHGILPDGGVVTGMEVFRRAYRAVGRGWVVGWTAWPIARPVMDACYRWFAANRLRITRRLFGRPAACEGDRCRV